MLDAWETALKRRARRDIKKQTRVAAKPRKSCISLRSTSQDVVLAMQEPYMQQIVTGQKTYEFRRYQLKPHVKRVWFYRTAPHSSIEYVCEILPARTRGRGDKPLDEDGLGNKEYNERHKDYDGYDYAYKILSVYRLEQALTLDHLRLSHGFKSAPRGMVYAPASITDKINWRGAKRLR